MSRVRIAPTQDKLATLIGEGIPIDVLVSALLGVRNKNLNCLARYMSEADTNCIGFLFFSGRNDANVHAHARRSNPIFARRIMERRLKQLDYILRRGMLRTNVAGDKSYFTLVVH